MKRILATGIVFEDSNGNVLVLRRHQGSREGNTWGLVGGNIDEGESSIHAAIRETREEINHEISQDALEFIKSYDWTHDDARISFDVFRYKTNQQDVNVELDIEENTEHMWVLPKDLHVRKDLMAGLYPILEDLYGI